MSGHDYAVVQQMLADLKLPICACKADIDGKPCFRVVPGYVTNMLRRVTGRMIPSAEKCVPCQEGYHGPGKQHGYRGAD
jgi:hypothetical protein